MTPTEQMIARVRNAHAARYNDVEHVTLRGETCISRTGPNVSVRQLTTLDDLHPWERDLVTNGAPFARPSNRVRS